MVFPIQPALPFTAWDDRRADETATSKTLSDLIGEDFEDSAHPSILNSEHPQHQTETLPL